MKKIISKIVLLGLKVFRITQKTIQLMIRFISILRVKFLAFFSDNQISKLKLFFQKILAQQNKYLIYLGLIVVAVAIAGFNLVGNNEQTVSAKENSLLVDLIFSDKDNIEIVKNEVLKNPNLKGSSYISFVSVASATSNAGLISNTKKAPKPLSTNGLNSQKKVLAKNASPVIEENQAKGLKKYTVLDGDTISQIAQKFGVDAATILVANDLYADDIIKPGMELTVLPVSGTFEKVDKGETLLAIADRYGVKESEIMKFNKLVMARDIEEGQILIIPDGKREIKERPRPEPDPIVLAAAENDTSNNETSNTNSETSNNYQETSNVTSTRATSNNNLQSTNNAFSWGWCTWYAAARRPDVTWMGNAGEWLYNAQAQGRATGRIPAVGAILVTNESWWGHVAIVEAVNGDSVTISEMNYQGFGIVSSRTISNRSGVIQGYIY